MVEISVIIPVYNSSEFLDECIGGILNQTFKDIELICVDDGSTDDSLNKLNDFAKKDKRVRVFHQENQGGGNARNFGLTKAKGKYLYFMDSDDILYLDALEKCYNICENKNVELLIFKAINYKVSTNEYFETEYFSMNKLYDFVGDDVFSIDDIGELIFDMSVTPWGKLYNREFIMNTGAQFAEGISFHDNKFFFDMVFNANRIIFLNEILYVRRLHSSSLIGSKNKGYFNSFIAFAQIFDLFKKYNKFNLFKSRLYNWAMDILMFRLKMIHQEYKQLFFERLKEEFTKFANEEGEVNLLNILNPRNKIVFKNVIEFDTHTEYSLSMENYDLNNENNNLKKEINELNSEIESLKIKISILNKENYDLNNENNVLNNENSKLFKNLSN